MNIQNVTVIVVHSKFQNLGSGTDTIAYSLLHYKNSIIYIAPKALYSPIVIGRLKKVQIKKQRCELQGTLNRCTAHGPGDDLCQECNRCACPRFRS